MAGTLSCPVPTNINPLSPNGFRFSIQKLPELTYFAQEVNLPGISFGEAILANPLAPVPIPGDQITYEQLNVRFLIDENMANFKAIHDWMRGLGFPESHTEYSTFQADDSKMPGQDPNLIPELTKNYSDGTLQILGSNNQPVRTIAFVDLFPTILSTIQFQSTSGDVQYLIGDATFRYTRYDFDE